MGGPRAALAAAALVIAASAGAGEAPGAFCPEVYRAGVLELPFNPAFLRVEAFNTRDGGRADALLMSSFFNAIKDERGEKVTGFFERDLVARIPDLDGVDPKRFRAKRDLEVLSDLDGVERQIWPNETARVPDGVLPFEAVVSPQGFIAAKRPGRLSILNVEDPRRGEYLVDQTSFVPPRCKPGDPDNQPWFYHDARWLDMDRDGLRDLLTVRSSLRFYGGVCPPSGELVWFKNPGDALRPDVEWDEHIIVGASPPPGGPEVNMNAADIDGDGVVEIIASHFFKHDAITIYGPPAGLDWSDVDPQAGRPVRQHDIMRGQGRPFAVEIVDLNLDGRLDVLTSNHQGDGCYDVTNDAIAGRIIAIEQPAEGGLYSGEWRVHVLKDGIRPNPTVPAPERGPGRLAPNRAEAFWPARVLEGQTRPWIVAGGDEAAKVWVLKPRYPLDSVRWEYDSAVIFDINDAYGAGTTQQLLDDPRGISISTVGGIAWRYDRPGPLGLAEIFIPVFEAKDIHILRFRPGEDAAPLACPADGALACPVAVGAQ